MRRHPIVISLVIACIFSAASMAQETPAAIESLLLENAYVRVTLVTIPAWGSESDYDHPDRLLYFLDSGEVVMSSAGEVATTIDAQGNHRFWQRAGRTAFSSAWPEPVRFISFQFKSRPGSGLDLNLDPATVAPAENIVIFENETIRVVQTITPPGGGGALHSHGPMAVCSLTRATLEITVVDGAARTVELNPASVIWSDPVTHRVRNIGTTTSHLLHIEFK